MSPVWTRRLPPDRPPHFLDYSVPPCLFLLLFLLFTLPAQSSSSPGVTAPVVLSLDAREVFCFFSSCLGVFFFSSVLSLQTASSLDCSDPRVYRLCWPTPTPCSFFLRTRKRLALLTPSRGLALAGLEKRPPGWAGRRGREGEREGGGPALVR